MMQRFWNGVRLFFFNTLFVVVMFVMGFRFLSGEPVLPELTETIGMWEELLGVAR